MRIPHPTVDRRESIRILVRLFVVVFVITVATMSVSRELLIPLMSTSAVDGDMAGDPQYYRSLALKKASEIRQGGLGQFELRPEGQGPAGIASLLFLVGESPYGVVGLNAALHAISVVVMALILMRWFPRRVSVIATVPLAISPLMVAWFSQINKDSYVTAGVLLFTLGLLRLSSQKSKLTVYDGLTALLVILFGTILIWIVRPYVNQILLPITALVLVVVFLIRARRRPDKTEIALFGMSAALALACIGLLGKGAASGETLGLLENFQSQTESTSVWARCLSNIEEGHWRDAQFLPDSVDGKLKAMMGQRCLTFTLLETQDNVATRLSIIDTDRFPGSSKEALGYIPRAFFLGIFSPWPDRWDYVLHNGLSVFYIVAPLEAALLYAGLMALIYWGMRNNAWSLLIPVALCLAVMTVYAMAIPFLGGLYRYRYPWWMLLICMGVAAMLVTLRRKQVDKPCSESDCIQGKCRE